MKKLVCLLLFVLITVSAVSCTAKPIVNNSANKTDAELPAFVVDAVKAANDVTSNDEVTKEMLEAVTSIEIICVPASEGSHYIEAQVNDSGLYAYFMGCLLETRYNEYIEKLDKALEAASGSEYDDISRDSTRLPSYCQCYDITAPELSEEFKAQMIDAFPILNSHDRVYVIDASISAIESFKLHEIVEKYINPNCKAVSNVLDLSSLSALPNLKSVKYSGCLTIENCPVPSEKTDGTFIH